MKKFLRKTVKISIAILCIAIFYILMFDPITTTFNITANTERITIKTLDESGSQLNLYDVNIYDNNLNLIFKKFTGSLKLNKETLVNVERIAFGPAILTFDAYKDKAVGTLFDENSSFVRHTGSYLRIFISDIKVKADSGQTFILPIDGKVNLGRSVDFEVPDESTAVLRSGQIYMTGSSTFSGNFDAGSTQLFLGDQITFDDQSSKAFGFITLNEEPGMQTAYRIIAKQATISKPGPKVKDSGFIIQANNLDRLIKAPSFQKISLFFGAVVAFTTIFTFLNDIPIIKKFILSLLK